MVVANHKNRDTSTDSRSAASGRRRCVLTSQVLKLWSGLPPMIQEGLLNCRGEVAVQPEEGAQRGDSNVRQLAAEKGHELGDSSFSDHLSFLHHPQTLAEESLSQQRNGHVCVLRLEPWTIANVVQPRNSCQSFPPCDRGPRWGRAGRWQDCRRPGNEQRRALRAVRQQRSVDGSRSPVGRRVRAVKRCARAWQHRAAAVVLGREPSPARGSIRSHLRCQARGNATQPDRRCRGWPQFDDVAGSGARRRWGGPSPAVLRVHVAIRSTGARSPLQGSLTVTSTPSCSRNDRAVR